MKTMQSILSLFMSLALCVSSFSAGDACLPERCETVEDVRFDLVVFGGTSAGVMAAVAAGREGHKVLLLESSYLIGGLMSGGLTKTDIGKRETIGGLSREFYDRVLDYYTKTYGKDSQQVKDCRQGYHFEPKVALLLFKRMMDEAGVVHMSKERLEKVTMEGNRVASIETRNYETGKRSRFSAKLFIDGSYEGDLMAQAGVLYKVGREARSEYGESLAGITAGPAEYLGKSDHRVQAYNLRSTLTDNPELMLPLPRPEVYYPEASAALVEAVKRNGYKSFKELIPESETWWALVNRKGDPNRADMLGVNSAYSEGDYEMRERIYKKVRDFWLSYWWRLQNDPELPEEFKESARKWGVPRDEYLESGHVTPQVYVRVSRRMLGRYFLTQHDVQYDRYKPDTICMGSYNTDAHPIQYIYTDRGRMAEGEFNGSADPYEIPYRAITPHGVENLLVVAAVSASHVAYSSVRMEPVFMMIGHGGGLAAHLALSKGISVQEVPVDELQAKLREAKMPLEAPYRPVIGLRVKTPPPYKPGQEIEFELIEEVVRKPLTTIAWDFDGSGGKDLNTRTASFAYPHARSALVRVIAVDGDGKIALPATVELRIGEERDFIEPIDVGLSQTRLSGRWERTRGVDIEYRARVGMRDGKQGDGKFTAEFTTRLPRSGRYIVSIAFPTAVNRARNVPLLIRHADGETAITLNQRDKPSPSAFMVLGEYRFEKGKPATVSLSNQGAKGYVTIDTVRWIWIGD